MGGKLELGDELSNNLKKKRSEAEPKGNRAQMILAMVLVMLLPFWVKFCPLDLFHSLVFVLLAAIMQHIMSCFKTKQLNTFILGFKIFSDHQIRY